MQFIFTGTDLAFRVLRFSQPQKGRPALDELFLFKHGGYLLKHGPFRYHHDFGGRMFGFGGQRRFSPLNRLIPSQTAGHGDDDQYDQHDTKFHAEARRWD